ncbi:MAG: DUF5683 domain-containing protein [Candidatus Krumholzibacteriia bacterium]
MQHSDDRRRPGDKSRELATPGRLALLLPMLLMLGPAAAAAEPGNAAAGVPVVPGSGLAAAERALAAPAGDGLALARWGGFEPRAQIGGTRGTPRESVGESGSGATGAKIKAGLLSLVLPGAGQFYNGDRTKAYLMAGAELAVWGTYLVFDTQGDHRTDDYIEYAGIYAGTSGDRDDRYWQSVGRYMDSDAYNESLLREARALQEPPPPLISGDAAWQWRNEERQRAYQDLRADAQNAYDRRDFMILFAVINRAVSVYDAVRNGGSGGSEPTLGADVMGWNVALDVAPVWDAPTSRCVVSRSF